LFGYHFLFFVALRYAPAVQANLVNYLWPLGMVLLAPVFLPGVRLQSAHIAAALLGFAGAALAITSGRVLDGTLAWGYIPALGSAFVWASYSLLTRRVPAFPTAAIGLFGLVSGMLALLCHATLEPAVVWQRNDVLCIFALGIGPLGSAFYLWDAALKRGDVRQIGLLSFLTPLLSTLALLGMRGEMPSASIVLAALLIVGGAIWGARTART
jgi:drug/metabolite transporter (DMT)-like permease